jgi:hypothetical protein
VAEESEKSGSGTKPGWLSRASAWQPLTGRGVAAFADASFGRLFFFQLLGAIASTLALLWALQTAYVPVFNRALSQLPERASVHLGRLQWPNQNAATLADSPHFAIAVRPVDDAEPDRTADLQVELSPRSIRLGGILGYHDWPYPPAAEWNLGRLEASALWAAWRWPLRFLFSVILAAAFIGAWWILQALFSPILWTLGLMFRRNLSFGSAWRQAGAAWLTAFLFADAAIFAYTRRWLALPGLAVALSVAVASGPVLMAWALASLRTGQETESRVPEKNPFTEKKKRPEKRSGEPRTEKPTSANPKRPD